MNTHTLLVFSAAVLPLICTPGPDMLFIASQAIAGSARAGLRATAGVLLGYLVHSALVAAGLAAVVAASPGFFEAIRWAGIAYLVLLASRLIRSAFNSSAIAVAAQAARSQVRKGFLTALLNPKGMMIYVAILPQFIDQAGNATVQAAVLALTFVFWCGVVYAILSLAIGRVGAAAGSFTAARRRIIDGGAGGLILLAAGVMAAK